MTTEPRNGAETLLVMEIERFAIHDGPGIRSVVFLKGCPLRCAWCANPESQRLERQLMYRAAKCLRCGACAALCPEGAVALSTAGGPVIDRARCTVCGACAAACPAGALVISGREMPVDGILAEVLRDREYYENSGGGITLSGGEPFLQFEGFLALLRAAKNAGLHVAVETAGQVSLADIRVAEPLVDLFLYDVKHADIAELKRWTGADGALVLDNLDYLIKIAPQKLLVRVPVIPGVNADRESMGAIFGLMKERGIGRLQLLPYHTLGRGKYAELGLDYALPEAPALAPQALLPFKQLGLEMGLDIIVE